MTTEYDTFSNRSQYRLRLTATEGTIDSANNRSIVNWSYAIEETSENGSWTGSGASRQCNVNGTPVESNGNFGYDFRGYNTLVLGSGSTWVTHNADGAKTAVISASVGGSTTIGTASVTINLPLTKINRAPSAPGVPSISGVEEHKMTVSWAAAAANGAAVLDYHVMASYMTDLGDWSAEEEVFVGIGRSFANMDLRTSRNFRYRVRARNSMGYSPYSGYSATVKTLSGVYIGQNGSYVPVTPMRAQIPTPARYTEIFEIFSATPAPDEDYQPLGATT